MWYSSTGELILVKQSDNRYKINIDSIDEIRFVIYFLIPTQNRGRYVNHVVIQENPVIMQDSDKTVRVECAFTAEDQTVSFRPTGNGDGRLENGGGISVT